MQQINIVTAKNVEVILINGLKPVHLPVPVRATDRKDDGLSPRLSLRALQKADRKSKKYLVARNSKPLPVTLLIDDSTQQTVYLHPHKNIGCFLNMKYIFRSKDSLDPYAHKRWTYPRRNVISVKETGISISRFAAVKKGTINIVLSPGLQLFDLQKDKLRYNNAGILGAELKAEYFYRANRFLSFAAGAATDKPPLPIDYFGPGYIERGSAVYVSVRNNLVHENFDAGYGISLSRLFWTAIPIGDTVHFQNRRIRTTGLGLSLSAHYKMRPSLKAGIVYQPNLVNLNRSPLFTYQHFIAIQLSWNFAVARRLKGHTHGL